MDIKNFAKRYMPKEVIEAVGSDRAEVAIKMASTAAARLDRNNEFFTSQHTFIIQATGVQKNDRTTLVRGP